jgi:hypothetical protein
MKLQVKLGIKTNCLFVSLILLSNSIAFSSQLEGRETSVNSVFENTPAQIKKSNEANNFVYSFLLKSVPDTDFLNNSIERFRQINGFISLSVNAQNEVLLVTENTISEQDNTRLLAISARLYGYVGYQIIL